MSSLGPHTGHARFWSDHILLIVACIAYAAAGFKLNAALAGLVAAPLLIRYVRTRATWWQTWPAFLGMSIANFFVIYGGWKLDLWMLVVFPFVKSLFIFGPLLLDRRTAGIWPPIAATLILPLSITIVDFVVSFTPLATSFSLANSFFALRELAQIAAFGGIWLLGIMVWWFATALNRLWEHGFDYKKAGWAFGLPAMVLAVGLVWGAVRISTNDLSAPTVRIAGISSEHQHDYWAPIDQGTPRAAVEALRPDAQIMQDRLFADSRRAAMAGADIIVWSEGACVLDADTWPAFDERARQFSKEYGVWLAAGILRYRFESPLSDNSVVMYSPEGKQEFFYTKTISWYPTDSDGVLPVVDTPYGRIGVAICFDMDTPAFIRQLAAKDADIVLVPAYDTQAIRPWHTEVGLFRAIENGFSVFRQVAHGASMAVDRRGIVRGYQDFFAGSDRVFIADLPMQGERPPAIWIADTIPWLSLAGFFLLILIAVRQKNLRAWLEHEGY